MLGRKVYVSEDWKYDYFMSECAVANMLKDECLIELTLNHPRNKYFRTCSPGEQKMIYHDAYEKIKQYFSPENIVRDMLRFEECKDGTIHCHAHIHFKFKLSIGIIPMAICSQIAQEWLSTLTPRYRSNASDAYNTQYRRIRLPSIVVQFVDIIDIKRAKIWEDYINKAPV